MDRAQLICFILEQSHEPSYIRLRFSSFSSHNLNLSNYKIYWIHTVQFGQVGTYKAVDILKISQPIHGDVGSESFGEMTHWTVTDKNMQKLSKSMLFTRPTPFSFVKPLSLETGTFNRDGGGSPFFLGKRGKP